MREREGEREVIASKTHKHDKQHNTLKIVGIKRGNECK